MAEHVKTMPNFAEVIDHNSILFIEGSGRVFRQRHKLIEGAFWNTTDSSILGGADRYLRASNKQIKMNVGIEQS